MIYSKSSSSLKKKTMAAVAVLTGYIAIPAVFLAQRPRVPGVASGAIKATAPAPRKFGL